MQYSQPKVVNVSSLLAKIQIGNQQAALELEKLGQIYPKNPEVLNALGCLALERGDGLVCLEKFDLADTFGYKGDNKRNRLIAHSMLGNIDDFNNIWNNLKNKAFKNNERIEILRSCLRGAQSKSQSLIAQHCLSLWREEAPDDIRLCLSEVGVAIYRHEKEKAIELLKSMPPIPLSEVDAILQTASYAILLKHYDSARYFFNIAQESKNINSTQLQLLIKIGNELKEFKKSLSLLDGLLKNHPDLAKSHIYERLDLCQKANHWDEVNRLVPKYLEAIRNKEIRSTGLFRNLSLPRMTDADHLMLANAYVEQLPSALNITLDDFKRKPRKNRRLRIGVLSADFRQHPVAQLVVEVFERINRSKFELIGFDLAEDHSSLLRFRILKSLDTHFSVRELKDDDLTEKIRNSSIDILLDLQGDTTDNRIRLLKRRLAPVQAGWLGFPGGLGKGMNDYIIADKKVIPTESFLNFAEKPVWLPNTYIPNDPERQPQKCPPRISQDLPDDVIVFCCFNGQYKITREIFHAWCRILREVSDSVLWLRQEDADVVELYRNVASEFKIAPDRIIFAHRTETQVEHLTRLQCADIALDTRPYNAHTTTIDALWARVPVITLPGATFASRVAASILHVAGLNDYVALDIDDYVSKAVSLARNAEQLKTLKVYLNNLRETSPLYDNQVFVDGLEAAFEAMYAQFESQQPPTPITDLTPWINNKNSVSTLPAKPSISLLLEHAETHLNKDQAREALLIYEEVIRLEPTQALALHGLGLSNALLGRYHIALEWFDKALALMPDNKLWRQQRDKVLERQKSNHADFITTRLERAHKSHSQGLFFEAEVIYGEILKHSPRHPAALHFLGLLKVQQGDADGLEHMRESIRLRPNNEAFLKNYRMAEKILKTDNDSLTL